MFKRIHLQLREGKLSSTEFEKMEGRTIQLGFCPGDFGRALIVTNYNVRI